MSCIFLSRSSINHGMGSLSYRKAIHSAGRSGAEHPRPRIGDYFEIDGQDSGGALSDCGWCGKRSPPVPGRPEPWEWCSRQLQIPEKLYGRERKVETLLASFDRVMNGGVPELVLVSGYSGIGKSSVVSELQPVLVPPRGLFASGKFDQYKRDIPYATSAQAFQSLIRQLLTESETELDRWRRDLRDALDQNGQLIVDMVPVLKSLSENNNQSLKYQQRMLNTASNWCYADLSAFSRGQSIRWPIQE